MSLKKSTYVLNIIENDYKTFISLYLLWTTILFKKYSSNNGVSVILSNIKRTINVQWTAAIFSKLLGVSGDEETINTFVYDHCAKIIPNGPTEEHSKNKYVTCTFVVRLEHLTGATNVARTPTSIIQMGDTSVAFLGSDTTPLNQIHGLWTTA